MAVALVGPTASGKSDTALLVARARPGPGGVELVSVDSMAVYRGMDLGTAKPSAGVRAEVPVHLVDLVDPDEEYTVTRFQRAAGGALEGIATRGGCALLVGGTGLYLRAVTDDLAFPGRFPAVAAELAADLDTWGPQGSDGRSTGCAALRARLADLDPVAAARIEPGNERRLVRALEVTLGSGRPFSSFGPGLERYPPSRITMVGLRRDAEESDRRIEERFTRLMDEGFLDEVRGLGCNAAQGYHFAAPRSAESRPEKQNAPSASVQCEKWRSAWMRRAAARGSVRADVARTARQRSLVAATPSSAAPASSSASAPGSTVAASVNRAAFGPERTPARSASSMPGRAPRRCPVAKVRRAWPVGTPSKVASSTAGDRWPSTSQWPEAAMRGASRHLAAPTRRSSLASEA